MTDGFNLRNEELIDIWFDYRAFREDPTIRTYRVNLLDIQSNELADTIIVHTLDEARAIRPEHFKRFAARR